MATNRSHRSLVLIGGAACLAGAAMLGFGAGRSAQEASPTSVAVINFSRLERNLAIADTHAEELSQIRENFQSQISALDEQIESESRELQDLVLPREEQFEKEQRILEREAARRAKVETSNLIIEFERSRRLVDRYEKMVQTTRSVAEELGYDLVLMRSDEAALGPLPDLDRLKAGQLENLSGRLQEQMLIVRRMVYVNDAVDITDEVMTRMNNTYKVGE